MITVTTFRWVPDFARGYVRDLRVRWALEEAGLPYRTRLIGIEDKLGPEHLARQPFGQVPAIEEDGLVLFETGAIALHLGERSEALMPRDAIGRARAMTWVVAALNSVEPYVAQLAEIDIFHKGEAWTVERRPGAEAILRQRLAGLAAWIGGRDWLEDRFTAGDLIMADVLRNLDHTELVSGDPVLGPYLARCTARPAFCRALRDHMAVFDAAA